MEQQQSNTNTQLLQSFRKTQSISCGMSQVATLILAGGQGSRLFPLTRSNCKPAVNFGGKYRLIDIPMSNAMMSGCQKIFIITQFLSKSLHDHILKTYPPNLFSSSVSILTVEEKPHAKNWFQGTADSIRQNLEYLAELPVDYFLILSGDQIYQMNYQRMLETAVQTHADVVVASLPVDESQTHRFGILKINADKRITDFIEKPQEKHQLEAFKMPDADAYLGSMGIYLFKRKVLLQLLKKDLREDFGKHLIPSLVEKGKAVAYLHEGYWEDIGTIESYFHANIALTQDNPIFNWYNENYPLASQNLNLPAPKISNTLIQHSIICEGSLIEAQEITHSIIGPRSRIKNGTIINQSYILGNEYEQPPHSEVDEKFQIGENCRIERAIIDKHVTIGNNVQLINRKQLRQYDSDDIFIRDGIIIVARGASIPDGFIL